MRKYTLRFFFAQFKSVPDSIIFLSRLLSTSVTPEMGCVPTLVVIWFPSTPQPWPYSHSTELGDGRVALAWRPGCAPTVALPFPESGEEPSSLLRVWYGMVRCRIGTSSRPSCYTLGVGGFIL